MTTVRLALGAAVNGYTADTYAGAVTLPAIGMHVVTLTADTVVTLQGADGVGVALIVHRNGHALTVNGIDVESDGLAIFYRAEGGWTLASSGSPSDGGGTPSIVAPTLTAPSVTQTTATTTWAAVSGATGYEARADQGAIVELASTATSWTATGLARGHTGTLQVRTATDAGTSTWASVSYTTEAPSANAYRAAVLSDSPTYYYPLDDSPGTTQPANLGSATAPIQSMAGVTFGSAGIGDGATAATFSSGYINLPSAARLVGATSLTFETIVNGSPQNSILISTGINAGATLYLGASTISNTYAFGTSNPAGARHHLAMTWDGTTLRYYVDGVEQNTAAIPSSASPLTSDSSDRATIGNGTRTEAPTSGVMAGVAIYKNVCLTPARIAAHASAATS